MTRKEMLINDILVAMSNHLTAQLSGILEDVLKRAFYTVEITEQETALADSGQSNEYILRLFEIKQAEKLSKKTMEQYISHARQLADTVRKPLTMITEQDIEHFLRLYKRRGNMNSTVNNCLRFMSAFFRWMRKQKLIIANPCDNIDSYKEPARKIEHLEPEQWEKLKTGCRTTRDRALLEFLRSTAMRDGEVPDVRICDVDWYEGKILIFGEKSHKYRLVCIDRVAKEYLQAYLTERGVGIGSREPLFASKTGSGMTKSGIYASIKRIAKQAKMDINVYPHLIRKTTATNIVKRGGTTEDAGDYLGHADRNTAGRYYAYKGDDHIIEIFRKRVAAV